MYSILSRFVANMKFALAKTKMFHLTRENGLVYNKCS